MKHTPLRSWYLSALLVCSALLSGCAGVCVGPLCVNSAERAGVPLLYADPGVRIERSSQGVVPYESGMALQTGDVIQTGAGYAVIDFDDENAIALRNNTRIQLGSVKLFLGEVFARVSQIVQRGGGQVTTDELSASVKGTEYSVRRAPVSGRADPGNTAVIVRKGKVWCEDPGGRWAPVELTENNIFRVDYAQGPRPLQYVNAQAETGWADDVFKRLLVPRQPQVTPTYTFPVFPNRERPREPRPREPVPPPPPRRTPQG